MTAETLDPNRERQIKTKAGWFANCVKVSSQPTAIPGEIEFFLQNDNERSRFERYLLYYGLFKRSDDRWARKLG